MLNLIDITPGQAGRIFIKARNDGNTLLHVCQDDRAVSQNMFNWALTATVTGTYRIVNHHFCDEYDVRTNNGTVSVTDDIVSYTPATEGAGGFWLNGTFYEVTVLYPGPIKPAVTSPIEGAVDQLPTIDLISPAFVTELPGMTHYATQWQVATDIGFTNIIHDETSQTDLLIHTVSGLESLTTYYVRVRHIGLLA